MYTHGNNSKENDGARLRKLKRGSTTAKTSNNVPT